MNLPNNHPKSMQDYRLADFTDRVLEGQATEVETGVDEELLDLEKTVLRLNQAFPVMSLDEAAVKQMQVRLNARMRRERQETGQPLWRKWFEPRFRLQFGMILIMIALAIVIVVLPISYTTAGPSMNATALTPTQVSVALALAGVVFILLWIWIKRRK